MDLEKAMEFVLEQEAKFHVGMLELTRKMDALTLRMDGLTQNMDGLTRKMDGLTDTVLEMEERHDREMSDLRAATAGLQAASADFRADLRRAIRMSVEEQRRERLRRQELDQKITQLAAAQVVTEEKLQRLIENLNHPRNGNR